MDSRGRKNKGKKNEAGAKQKDNTKQKNEEGPELDPQQKEEMMKQLTSLLDPSKMNDGLMSMLGGDLLSKFGGLLESRVPKDLPPYDFARYDNLVGSLNERIKDVENTLQAIEKDNYEELDALAVSLKVGKEPGKIDDIAPPKKMTKKEKDDRDRILEQIKQRIEDLNKYKNELLLQGEKEISNSNLKNCVPLVVQNLDDDIRRMQDLFDHVKKTYA
eukprot:TRINITY_DN198_c0_g1_i1.p1 TRINITY_DN198_c0_g1~~TRINITY_DN198_c0_g1_i1.p1  ORF type:complete len:217 (-),score=84.39 TRINITY_DN198_c0_g1_i1:100-750(-)